MLKTKHLKTPGYGSYLIDWHKNLKAGGKVEHNNPVTTQDKNGTNTSYNLSVSDVRKDTVTITEGSGPEQLAVKSYTLQDDTLSNSQTLFTDTPEVLDVMKVDATHDAETGAMEAMEMTHFEINKATGTIAILSST